MWVKILIVILLLKTDSLAETEEEQWDRELRAELSDAAYFGIKEKNVKDYKLNYSVLEEVYKRLGRFDTNTSMRKQLPTVSDAYTSYYWGPNIIRICKMVTNSFRSGINDFRRYFPLRVTYSETLEYEVGYLTNDIVQRYQNLIELFHIIHRRYALRNDTDLATTRYMFYMYRTMVNLGTTIVHLCNMMHEVERKYRGYVGLWTVNITESGSGKKKKKAKEFDKTGFLTLQQRIKAIEKWRKQQASKRRKEHAAGNIEIYVPTREPARTNWPLIYGWSIEDWWM